MMQVFGQRKRFQPGWIPAVTFLLFLSLTLAASYYANRYFQSELNSRFVRNRTLIYDAIHLRMQDCVNLLVHTRGFFDAGGAVSARDFRAFSESIQVRDRYPGLKSLGFLERIRENPPAYRVRYIEPTTPETQKVLGYDPSVDPVRQSAMNRARDSGKTSSSVALQLRSDDPDQRRPSFLLYLPVYVRGKPISTLEERRHALKGFVVAGFNADRLFDSVVGQRLSTELFMDFEVYSGLEPTQNTFLHDHDRVSGFLSPGFTSPFTTTMYLQVADATWSIVFYSLPGFASFATHAIPIGILLVGSLISIALGGLGMTSQNRGEKEQLARRRSEFLYKVSGGLFKASLQADDRIRNLISGVIPDLADWAGAILLSESGEISKVAFEGPVGLDQLKTRIFENFSFNPSHQRGLAEVLKNGTPLLHSELTLKDLRKFNANPEFPAVMQTMKMSSLIEVPIIFEDRILGALVLIGSHGRTYKHDDLLLAIELGKLAGVAIENVQLFRKAQDAVQIRDEFISVASHELRTPLTSLKLQTQLAARRLEKQDETQAPAGAYRAFLKSTNQQSDRIAALVENMLDVSQIRAGKLLLHYEELDVSEVLRDICTRYEEQLRQAGCELRRHLPQGLTGRWDRLRLEQIFVNLLMNAIKYAPGSPIEIHAEADAMNVRVCVKDEGPGISLQDQERIFKRYERASSAAYVSGLGLGLYIVKQIVQAHQGLVKVESAPERGTTFHIELPRSPLPS